MILYVDKQSDNDAICGFNMSSNQYKYLTERNGRNIQGLAFDPASELLFFTDTKERSINWISLIPGAKNNVHGNVLIKMDDGIPTDIAVDCCRGYIYWLNTNHTTAAIERARFNGSDREVVLNSALISVNTTYKLKPHSLALDQQTQSIYWIDYENSSDFNVYTADLNGNKKSILQGFQFNININELFSSFSNTLTISRETLLSNTWTRSSQVWSLKKKLGGITITKTIIKLLIETPASIVANYKVSDQIQGIKDCEALTSLVRNNSLTSDPFRVASKYVGEFCVYGVQVTGQSLCKCAPGYIGERCDVSVCDNYCMQGSCSVNVDGLPKCRCNAGYSGERCQVNACHGFCQNGGECSLVDKSEPVCECKAEFSGVRCEVSDCLNYCLQGNCTVNESGLPKCRCDAGYSGARCEINSCHGYCLNNGECSLNEEDEPVCQCVGNHKGSRCETVTYDTITTARTPYPAERSLPGSVRCEITDCLNYCLQGNCSVNDDGLPKCRCDAGYSGARCEINSCHGYCLNNGECSLNEEDEPVCQCVGNHEGSRCETVTYDTITTTRTPYPAERSLPGNSPTFADIFSKWKKPVSKITVILESS